ncbi:UNVERIFIED_CONTAM: hypothetical protein HDU68_001274 [Siphonaria sp. JEL0065]|nr:hypothetical protein HDU68_001274 [Siphonaria sp. JEL0065]
MFSRIVRAGGSSLIRTPVRAFSSAPKAMVNISAKPARLRRINPLTILGTNAPPEPEEAVDNILYNAPKPSKGPTNRHVLTLLVANETGVLSRISGVIAARGFNIESIVVCKTEVPALSRMTVVLKGKAAEIDQARRQLDDLVPVWAVLDYTGTPIVERELALVKVSAIPPESVHDDLAAEPSTPGLLSPIMAAGFHRQNVIALAQNYGAVVEDLSHDAVVLQLTAKPEKVDAFVAIMKPYGLIEVVRSGCMAVPRSPIETYDENNGEEPIASAMAVDASQLPPG